MATGNGAAGEPFKLRGGSYTLLVVPFADLEREAFFEWLDGKIAQAPYFFQHAPLVIDLQDVAEGVAVDFAPLAFRLRAHNLVPVGVQNGSDDHNRAAIQAGLSVFSVWRSASAMAARRNEPVNPPGAPDNHFEPTRLVEAPVRSGRQIYARNGDLVVLSPVSPGGEVLADGNIHVYGALRGRAFAGVSGNQSARIFCRSLEAELVAIAGYWRVREDIEENLIGQPAQIYLEGEQVVIRPAE